MFHYKVISTGESSAKYGNCEICGKRCAEVFHQIESSDYTDYEGNHSRTYYNCHEYFGHKECIESKQR